MFTEGVADFLIKQMGIGPYWALAFGFFYLVPLLLLAAVILLDRRGAATGRNGLLLGGAAATWASLSWLVIPWMGGYPCLPSLLVLAAFGWAPVEALPKKLFVHAVNFLIWPPLGWLVFRSPQKSRKPQSSH